jgi:conjugal transfer pilus assembly protein TraF
MKQLLPVSIFVVSIGLMIPTGLSAQPGSLVSDYPSAWQCDRTKFIWYCEVDELDDEETPYAVAEHTRMREMEAIEQLEALQQELKGKRALAIIDPTPENVAAYIELQNASMNQASVFSDVWRRVVWQTPALNYELHRPVNNAGIEVQRQVHQTAVTQKLNEISREWGIFFFFRSGCPYCHVMSSTLKVISDMHGITIFPISLDGSGLPEYPNPSTDNGMAKQLNVQEVPMMVLGNVKTRNMVALGSGVISSQEMIERMYILTATQPGELY